MKNKIVSLIALIIILAFTTYIGYNSLSQPEQLDLSDPYDEHFDWGFSDE